MTLPKRRTNNQQAAGSNNNGGAGTGPATQAGNPIVNQFHATVNDELPVGAGAAAALGAGAGIQLQVNPGVQQPVQHEEERKQQPAR